MRIHARRTIAVILLQALNVPNSFAAQQPDNAAIIQRIDGVNQARYDNVLGFTVMEHYTVYRGADQTHSAAEMTVRTTYKRGAGKSYTILSQSGSELIQRFGLRPLLDNEKAINDPARVRQSWFTSSNYEMKLKPDANQRIDGRDCLALSITPHQKAPSMIDGTLWVDAANYSIVQVEGAASRSPSVFAHSTKMMRRYADMNGYSMATHARAESNSLLFGRTVVTIDYTDYHFQLRPKN